MHAKVFVDTNILLYAYDRDAAEKHNVAAALIGKLWDAGMGVISIQVMQEFYVNVTSKIPKPLTPAKARGIIIIYETWQVELIHPSTIVSASEMQERYKLSFWDAMIIATANQGGVQTLLTEDLSHGQVIAGVSIFNPFREFFDLAKLEQ